MREEILGECVIERDLVCFLLEPINNREDFSKTMKPSFEFEKEIRSLEELQGCRRWNINIEVEEFIICDTLQGTSRAYFYVSVKSGTGIKSTEAEGREGFTPSMISFLFMQGIFIFQCERGPVCMLRR